MKSSTRLVCSCLVAFSFALSGEIASSQDANWIAGGGFFHFGSNWSTGVVPTDTARFNRSAAYPVRFTADQTLETAEVSAGQVQFLLDPGALDLTSLRLNGPAGTSLELSDGRVDAVQVRIGSTADMGGSLLLTDNSELHVGPIDPIFGVAGGLVLGPGGGAIGIENGASLHTADTVIYRGRVQILTGSSWIDTGELELGAGGSFAPAVVFVGYSGTATFGSVKAGLQGPGSRLMVDRDSVVHVLGDFDSNDVELWLELGALQIDGALKYDSQLKLSFFNGLLDVGSLQRKPGSAGLPFFSSGTVRVRGDLNTSDYGRAVAYEEVLQVDGALEVASAQTFQLGYGRLIVDSLTGKGVFDFSSSNAGRLEIGRLRLSTDLEDPTTLTIGDPSKLYSGDRMQSTVRNSADVDASAMLTLQGVNFSSPNLTVAGELVAVDTLFGLAPSQSPIRATGATITGTARLTDSIVHGAFQVEPEGDILIFGETSFDGPVTFAGAVRGSGSTHLFGSLEVENALGDPKSLVFTGDLALGPDHHLYLDIGPAGYERLIVGKSLELDGQLTVRATPDFSPQPGDVFNFFTAQTLLGNFASIDLPQLKANLAWVFTPGSAMIVSVPEPSTSMLLAVSGILFFVRLRNVALASLTKFLTTIL